MMEPERLQRLLEISRSLNSEVDLEKLMWKIVPLVREMLGADRGSVFLLDKDRGELWSLVAEGDEVKEIRFSVDKGIAGYVARTGRTVNIPDAYSDPRFNREVDRRTGYRTKSILCSPMKNLQGEVIGVVQILNKLEGDTFTKDDEIALEAFAAQAAIAIENALLYAKIEGTYEQTLQALVALLDRRDVGNNQGFRDHDYQRRNAGFIQR